ncbi:hypothetical protein B0O80DRAFT_495171 [Mortierella sp. GBAus27b]|nr:hypothetical protein B0O80DRAFT_495171 [Mortierella sp. GBAus27b]
MVHIPANLALATAIAFFGPSIVTVQGGLFSSAYPTAGCIIYTPSTALRQGQSYEVHFSGCRGRGNIQLRYGSPANLAMDRVPACANVDFSSGRCVFIPRKTGSGFSFSTTDIQGKETFSAPFSILPYSVTGAGSTVQPTVVQPQPQTLAQTPTPTQTGIQPLTRPTVPSGNTGSVQKPGGVAPRIAKRSLYRL